MKKIHFVTPSIIDPKCWSLVGVSAKPNSTNPIGQFGTGLKYAIAICLRKKWDIKFYSKKDSVVTEYKFNVKQEDFRDSKIEVIYCNDAPLPYTTHLGSHWGDWTPIRELYSNTLDENGKMHLVDDEELLDINENETHIVITSDECHEIANNLEEYILSNDVKIIAKNDHFELLPEKYAGKVYLKGVLVGEIKDCKFGYNVLKNLSLSEDRKISDQWMTIWDIMSSITRCSNPEEFTVLLMSEGAEKTFQCPSSGWSDQFKELAKQLARENPTSLNSAVFRDLIKSNELEHEIVDFNKNELLMLNIAIKRIENGGFNTNFPIHKIKSNDNVSIAFALKKEIYMTDKVFALGMDRLTAVLIEEMSHCIGYNDESREYEHYLCCQLARLLWVGEMEQNAKAI